MNCLILGCVLNVEKYIDDVFNNIKKVQTCFKESKIILYYDEGSDNTLEKLNHKKDEFNLQIIENKSDILIAERTLRIQNARNCLLDEAYKKCNKKYDYFIMMDMDDACNENININVLNKWLDNQHIDKWNALSFNNKSYYDYWALRIGTYQESVWKDTEPYELMKRIRKFMNLKLKKNELIKVESAFNGFSIHKKNIFKDVRYITLLKDYYDCEHVGFYKDIDKVMITRDCLFDEYCGEHKLKL